MIVFKNFVIRLIQFIDKLFIIACLLVVALVITMSSIKDNPFSVLVFYFLLLSIISLEYRTSSFVSHIFDKELKKSILKIKFGVAAIMFLYAGFLIYYKAFEAKDILDFYYKIWTNDFDKDNKIFERSSRIFILGMGYLIVSAIEEIYEKILNILIE